MADGLETARLRLAIAMGNPKDTTELNAARAELTKLEQEVGCFIAPGGPRVYGSGTPSGGGYRDLAEQLGDRTNNPTYAGSANREIKERTTGGLGPTTAVHNTAPYHGSSGHPHSPRDNGLPARDYSGGLPVVDYSGGGRKR
jgi:hypothetical protein